MAKYRKKPLLIDKLIEAEQFFKEKKPWPQGVDFDERFEEGPAQQWAGHVKYYFVITIHGQKTWIVDGDWIIQEPDGEHYYPCKPDIFEQTYEKVE